MDNETTIMIGSVSIFNFRGLAFFLYLCFLRCAWMNPGESIGSCLSESPSIFSKTYFHCRSLLYRISWICADTNPLTFRRKSPRNSLQWPRPVPPLPPYRDLSAFNIHPNRLRLRQGPLSPVRPPLGHHRVGLGRPRPRPSKYHHTG